MTFGKEADLYSTYHWEFFLRESPEYNANASNALFHPFPCLEEASHINRLDHFISAMK